MARYKQVRVWKIVFVFKCESDYPELLHIWAHHLKTDSDAIHIFFKGGRTWNVTRQCWESRIGSEVLRWYWIDEDARIVMIISCFDE